MKDWWDEHKDYFAGAFGFGCIAFMIFMTAVIGG